MPMCGAGFGAIPADQPWLRGVERVGAGGHHPPAPESPRCSPAQKLNRKAHPLATTTSPVETPASDVRPDSVQVATTQTIELAHVATRREHDLLGERDIPTDAYWGVHTMRAVENFPITGVPVGHFSNFVRALVYVKQAAARANRRLGYLSAEKADAIERACSIIGNDGKHHDQF